MTQKSFFSKSHIFLLYPSAEQILHACACSIFGQNMVITCVITNSASKTQAKKATKKFFDVTHNNNMKHSLCVQYLSVLFRPCLIFKFLNVYSMLFLCRRSSVSRCSLIRFATCIRNRYSRCFLYWYISYFGTIFTQLIQLRNNLH